jgi:hypothetical protein
MSEARGIGQLMRVSGYRQLLQTDEWKEFSEQFKERHQFACQVCHRGRPEVQVQTHHYFYDGTREPWEYPDNELACLCEWCHKAIHEQLQSFRKHVFCHLTPNTLRILNGALTVGLQHNEPIELSYAIAEMCSSPNSVKRFAAAWKP